MSVKVCFVYPWATFGGVERVLLNRLIAFKNYAPEVMADIIFLNNSAGLSSLQQAIKAHGIKAGVFVSQDFESYYDLIFCIDCPQAFEICKRQKLRYLVECHTSYPENRQYLQNLPSNCEGIIVPSQIFGKKIRYELGNTTFPINELRNFVPWDIDFIRVDSNSRRPKWNLKPILFFGRMDKLKDPLSLLDAFLLLEQKRPQEFMIILCGPQSNEIDIQQEIENRQITSKVILLPPVPFLSTNQLLEMVRDAGGIFVSPSRGESYGLSAAEAISSGMPVLLSNIDEHLFLVNGFESLLTYKLGNIEELSTSIENVFDNNHAAKTAAVSLRDRFSAQSFIDDWKQLLSSLRLS